MANRTRAWDTGFNPFDIISGLDYDGIVVGDDVCCYMDSSCGDSLRAVCRMQDQVTDGTGATRYMARWDVGYLGRLVVRT